MVRGTTSRMIFLDSTVNTHGDRTKISVPPHPFSAVGSERIALTLQQFSIRRNWFNINESNNTGFVYVNATYYQFTIPPGVYSTFDELRLGLQVALNSAATGISFINSFVVAYISMTRSFNITVTMASGHTDLVEIRCLHIKTGALPPGVNRTGGFNDSHLILGGKPLKSATDDFQSLTNTTGPAAQQTIVSPYPVSLNTLDAIYLHLVAFETGNSMSTGLEANTRDDYRLIESSLFARIPFDRSSFDEVHEVVQYVDTNDTFQSFPLRKNLEQLELRVCDSKGRSLAQLNPQMADDGLMGWEAVIRYDLFVPPKPPQSVPDRGRPTGPIVTKHPPTL